MKVQKIYGCTPSFNEIKPRVIVNRHYVDIDENLTENIQNLAKLSEFVDYEHHIEFLADYFDAYREIISLLKLASAFFKSDQLTKQTIIDNYKQQLKYLKNTVLQEKLAELQEGENYSNDALFNRINDYVDMYIKVQYKDASLDCDNDDSQESQDYIVKEIEYFTQKDIEPEEVTHNLTLAECNKLIKEQFEQEYHLSRLHGIAIPDSFENNDIGLSFKMFDFGDSTLTNINERDRRDKRRYFSPKNKVELVGAITKSSIKIAKALDVLHKKGIIHGDIKPANILLGKDGNPVIIDMGSSYPDEFPNHINRKYPKFSAYYTDVDLLKQSESFQASKKNDIYALAVTLLEYLHELMRGDETYYPNVAEGEMPSKVSEYLNSLMKNEKIVCHSYMLQSARIMYIKNHLSCKIKATKVKYSKLIQGGNKSDREIQKQSKVGLDLQYLNEFLGEYLQLIQDMLDKNPKLNSSKVVSVLEKIYEKYKTPNIETIALSEEEEKAFDNKYMIDNQQVDSPMQLRRSSTLSTWFSSLGSSSLFKRRYSNPMTDLRSNSNDDISDYNSR